MSVTLNELYERVREKKEIRLVAGRKGMNRIVRWVHMVEGIDISLFLEGDEIAFTTGIALSDAAQLVELVKYNYMQQAAGMVINVGPYIEKIPQAALDFADENSFPIFEVPWRVHMANIMREFSSIICMDEQKKLELEGAVKNAVYAPETPDVYLPVFLRHGYKREWSYLAAVLEFEQEKSPRLSYFCQELLHDRQNMTQVFENGNELQLLCANTTEEQLKAQLARFGKEAEKAGLSAGAWYCGVGNAVKGILDIGSSFSQAEQIKRLQKKLKKPNEIMTYREAGLYKLLFSLENTGLLEEYHGEVLGALKEYDASNGSDFVQFLHEFFRLDCSVSEAAAKLHMHRNTVTYKLHKIEEILGLALNTQENRTRLAAALMIDIFIR